jgi:hypothetical protein
MRCEMRCKIYTTFKEIRIFFKKVRKSFERNFVFQEKIWKVRDIKELKVIHILIISP